MESTFGPSSRIIKGNFRINSGFCRWTLLCFEYKKLCCLDLEVGRTVKNEDNHGVCEGVKENEKKVKNSNYKILDRSCETFIRIVPGWKHYWRKSRNASKMYYRWWRNYCRSCAWERRTNGWSRKRSAKKWTPSSTIWNKKQVMPEHSCLPSEYRPKHMPPACKNQECNPHVADSESNKQLERIWVSKFSGDKMKYSSWWAVF